MFNAIDEREKQQKISIKFDPKETTVSFEFSPIKNHDFNQDEQVENCIQLKIHPF